MRPSGLSAEPAKPVRKPVGGYRLMSVTQLCMAWHAYREGHTQFRDLRVWFALHELVARRCEIDSERSAAFTTAELRGLVGGVGGEHLRRSLARLARSGLVSWSEREISFPASPDGMPGDLSAFWTMLNAIQNNRRRVPVPRRTVRLIAQCGKPAVVATILGTLLRCVYVRQGGIVSEGAVKCSWIAETFRVGERNVKAARKFLAALAWLEALDVPQWYKNRYGARIRVNLAWERPDSYADRATESAPPPAFSTTGSAPPCLNQKPLQERSFNQKPAAAADRPAGFLTKERKAEALASPALRDVKPADLQDTSRTLALYGLATQAKLIEESDWGRLTFVSLAEHAIVHGTKNPAGLFVWLLKERQYAYITNGDEDAAQQRLKHHAFGRASQRESEKPKLVRVEVKLSEDAKLVAAVERVCVARRIEADRFLLVKREKPEWTRERWDNATVELENAQFARWQGG